MSIMETDGIFLSFFLKQMVPVATLRAFRIRAESASLNLLH